VKESVFSEENCSLAVEFDSYNPDYFIDQNIDEHNDERPLKVTFRMFDKVKIICKIKASEKDEFCFVSELDLKQDSKRELDMGIRLIIEEENKQL
jgi:hypothetical protein